MSRSRAQRLAAAARQHQHELIAARDYPRLLRQALDRLFPSAADRAVARRLLEQYGVAPNEQEIERVRIAILKLSGGDMSELAEHVAAAKDEYEDTLWWAETPRHAQLAMANRRLSASEAEAVAEEDRKQYEHWLETHTQVT